MCMNLVGPKQVHLRKLLASVNINELMKAFVATRRAVSCHPGRPTYSESLPRESTDVIMEKTKIKTIKIFIFSISSGIKYLFIIGSEEEIFEFNRKKINT